ncbi:MAG: pseudouridine synthase [Deltaproteobacteria bacterium]
MIVRLNKFLSMCGICSRRRADELIAEGRVRVNGVVAEELGRRVDTEADSVQVGGRVVKSEAKRYVALYKPRLYITALGEGEDDKKTIEELIRGIDERVYPVGRLDYDSEGLLILTNDGELANKIHHPSFGVSKVYIAKLNETLSDEAMKSMLEGAELEDGFAKPDWVRTINRGGQSASAVEIAFHDGRNHLVKRFFEQFGHRVMRLKRVAIGNIKLGRMQRGEWRDISEEELKTLKALLKPRGKSPSRGAE